MPLAHITDITFSAPPLVDMEEFAAFLGDDRGGDVAERVIGNAAIRTKGMAVNPLVEDPRWWTTAQRMDRSLVEARHLGHEVVKAVLDRAGLTSGDVGLLVTSTTTTHSVPGLETLAYELGMPPNVALLSLGPMGCYGALPSLVVTADWVLAHHRPAVLLCVDLFSPHLQPPPYETEEAVILTLFGDGAAAVVVRPPAGDESAEGERGGLALVDSEMLTVAAHADDLQVHMGDSGVRIRLAPTIPDVVAAGVAEPVERLLRRHGLCRADVRWWALHPGGRRVIERVAEELGIDDESVEASRGVMGDYGNTAAPAVLAVLDRLQGARPLGGGEYGVALAFGPGATIWTVLLRGA
jgi:predicted naringenin-chalcone synthase